MMEWLTLLAFVPAALALNLTPGADMLFCLGQGLRSGPRAAVAASAGISAGGMVHVALAGLGLSAFLATAPWAFDVIRWVGVGYLLWLAVQSLRIQSATRREVRPLTAWTAFRTGLVVNLLNPKVILFVLAFVPQFIDPTRPVLPQFLICGAIIGLGGLAVNGGVGVFASGAGRRLAEGSRVLDWITAGIFGALAARLAIMERV